MGQTKFSLTSAFALLLCTAVPACGSDEASPDRDQAGGSPLCVAGVQVVCECPGGLSSVQVCSADGTRYEACQCGGSAGSTGSAGTTAGASAGTAPIAGASAGTIAAGSGVAGDASVAGTGAGTSAGTNAGMAGTGAPLAGAAGTTAGMAGTGAPATDLARDIRIAELAIYQAAKVSLALNGEAVIARNAPVIVGKEGLLRISVEPLSGFSPREIAATLTLISSEGPGGTHTVMQQVSGASEDGDLDSTLNILIPGEEITADVTFSVELHEVASGASGMVDSAARFPTAVETMQELGARDAGPLRVEIVPYRYQGDGSGRLPAMDQAQLDLYESFLHSYYPASQIELSVHEPVDYNGQVGPNTGWEQWLEAHCTLRTEEDPDPKLLYYGVMSPRASMRDYGGGIVGISPVPNPASNYRCSVGVGFEGNISASTMAHELGHSLGLPHAPCGTSGGPFPYAEAKIGVWGYSLGAMELRDPNEYHDLMSYCSPSFISDYNFEKLFERIRYLNLQFKQERSGEPVRYARVLVDRDGRPVMRGYVDLYEPPDTEEHRHAVSVFDHRGRATGDVPGYYIPFSEGRAGTWLIAAKAAASVRIEGLGRVQLQ